MSLPVSNTVPHGTALLRSMFRVCGSHNTSEAAGAVLLCCLNPQNFEEAAASVKSESKQSWAQPVTNKRGTGRCRRLVSCRKKCLHEAGTRSVTRQNEYAEVEIAEAVSTNEPYIILFSGCLLAICCRDICLFYANVITDVGVLFLQLKSNKTESCFSIQTPTGQKLTVFL